MPAATVNDYGEGKAYYIAFRNQKKDYIRVLTNAALDEAGVKPCIDTTFPDGTTAHMREADGVRYFFVECYEPAGADIKLDGEYYDMLTDKTVTDVHFDGVGIAILKK